MFIELGTEKILIFVRDIIAVQWGNNPAETVIYTQGSHVFVVDESRESVMTKITDRYDQTRSWK